MQLDRYDLGFGVHAAFTDRRGGVSSGPYAELNIGGAAGADDPDAIAANRARVAAELGIDPAQVVWMRQVHGADVVTADASWPDEPPAADAVVTRTPGLALAVRVADCTPIVLADPRAGVLAAAHAGRPGLAAGVVPAAVEGMRALGADPAGMAAVIGPTVCGGCYEVPAEMRAEVVAASGAPEAWSQTRWGTPAVDVAAGVAAQLAAAGVADVTKVDVCTRESQRHYSYRRDGETGRFAGYIWADA